MVATVAEQGGYLWAAIAHPEPTDPPQVGRHIHMEIAKLFSAAAKYPGTVVRTMTAEEVRKAPWARPRKDGSPPTKEQILVESG